MTAAPWLPERTRHHSGPPPVGALIAREHAVWEITAVADLPLSDADREVWLAAGMPDLASWRGRPYRVDFDHRGGAHPAWCPPGKPAQGRLTQRAQLVITGYWYVYPSNRWPVCSCCGEPMPCRAELQELEVAAGLVAAEQHAQGAPAVGWEPGAP